jgi:predicted alpha/beta superfamily hydrolase
MICLFSYNTAAQLTIHLASLPASTPDSALIFLAGNINNWNAGDSAYIFEIREGNDYWLDSLIGDGTMEFKFTRGSWETVEGNENGNYRPNRSFTFGSADTIHLNIESWEDLDNGGGGANSTANSQVQIWDASMYMPQLERNRRIWVYLPQDYGTSTKSYPVLYMHDGQNVFDASTSFAGEWRVDETLTRLENDGKGSAIVVAIDNGGSHRIDEYSPFINSQYGGGEGDAYLDFIIDKLKPTIDEEFRTLKDAENTGIMGSSLGGLISHYAHFRNPEIFGRAVIFSPSYWFSDEYYSYTEDRGLSSSSRIYIVAGSQEASISQGVSEMEQTLLSEGFTDENLSVSIVTNGTHSEGFWAQEFEDAFMWLFYPDQIEGIENPLTSEITIFPNPCENLLNINGSGLLNLKFFSPNGSLLKNARIEDSGAVELSDLEGNSLFLLIEQDGKEYSFKILKL